MLLNELTLGEAHEGLASKNFSACELIESCLKRVKDRNNNLNAFITITPELALSEARKADALIAGGQISPLTGIPFSVKDAICVEGVRSTGAARILDNYIPAHEATVIGKIRAQGGVVVGKTNCDAFGHGASNENSMYGPVKNPRDETKVAGGSSGGAAASVADNHCIFAIAEDTGGSIRQPASFCGVVGLRPSYGRNSRYGVMPMASSLDTVGPMTKTVEDLALVMQVIAGHDSKDATTVNDPVPDYLTEVKKGVNGLVVGVPKEYLEVEGIDDEVKEITLKNIEKLRAAGCKIKEVSLPHTKYAISVYYIIVPSEDSSNLGRLEGIRYGVRAEAKDLFETYSRAREAGFPEEVKRRILIGTYALSAGYYDAYYKKALAVRTLIRQDFEEVFKDVQALISPASPFPAFGMGEKAADPLALYLADATAIPASVAGLPALSVPGGITKAGLPVGIQIIGPRLSEGLVLRLGNSIFKD